MVLLVKTVKLENALFDDLVNDARQLPSLLMNGLMSDESRIQLAFNRAVSGMLANLTDTSKRSQALDYIFASLSKMFFNEGDMRPRSHYLFDLFI